jgi:hypothetical protein
MSYNVTIDTSKVQAMMAKIKDKMENSGGFLEQFLENRVVPQLESQSASKRRVRTGTYSTTWEARSDSANSAEVTTDAYYWGYLEYGTSRGIKPVPVVGGVIQNIQDDLVHYVAGVLQEAVSR